MAFQDRHYYRDSGSGAGNPLMWLLTGSVHLFTAFGIRVRAHATFLLFIALVLLLGLGRGTTLHDRAVSMAVLFGIVLLHEFGHCFAARWTGGSAEEVMLTPLGGLAFTMARRRWWPTFVTVAGGPLVNVIICIVTGLALLALGFRVPLNPYGYLRVLDNADVGWWNVAYYLYWIYYVSYLLLLFNVLPVFPLDGGQMLQALLWPRLGYYRSMMVALNVGLVGSVLMFAYGLLIGGGLMILLIAVWCFMNCFQLRAQMKTEGPWGFAEEDSIDYTSSLHEPERKPGRRERSAARRAEKLAQEERAERQRIDAILEKVSRHGMNSLTWWEKRTLKKATEHRRQRDLELGRSRRI